MENIPDWAAYLMENQNVIGSIPFSYITYVHQALSYAYTAQKYFYGLCLKIADKPDIASIALLLVILYISMKLLGMLKDALFFWFRMAKRIAFWGGLAILMFWMWTRGPDGAIEDLNRWYETWNGHYERYSQQQDLAKKYQQQMGGGRPQHGWGF